MTRAGMDLRERLAALEHEQWILWSRTIAETEPISPDRIRRWATYWVRYSDLPEDAKEQDRVWADKVLAVLAASPDPEGPSDD